MNQAKVSPQQLATSRKLSISLDQLGLILDHPGSSQISLDWRVSFWISLDQSGSAWIHPVSMHGSF